MPFHRRNWCRISASELQNVLTWINKDITVAEIGQILREVDTNNDGASVWAVQTGNILRKEEGSRIRRSRD